jgi:hypothetical protein
VIKFTTDPVEEASFLAGRLNEVHWLLHCTRIVGILLDLSSILHWPRNNEIKGYDLQDNSNVL